MPPKRLRRHSPSNSGPVIGERFKRAKLAGSDYSAWGWVGSEVTDASEISQNHRLATCGFASTNNLSLCANKYPATSVSSSSSKGKGKASAGELEDDIIVISDDEDSSCSSKECKGNVYCLNHLGQDTWEDEDRARDAFLKHANLGENPIYLARDPGSPIGLKNLGATCYANAFLQVWFQDLAFRRGVYQCVPPQDSAQKFEESPIFQLQVTFAAMEENTQNAFNPVKLVESLRLRTTEQQDAQEFSKLFMAHLDSEFQKQSALGLKSLLADQFQGKQVYGTVCSNCKNKSERESEFLEVEVNIPKNNAKLDDRLSALLQPEELSGDNKYFCSVCDALQDAKRYTEFRQLPPVLHVSLLRFIFDLQTMERKKSKNAISFPLTLDMTPFLGSQEDGDIKMDSSDPSNIYHLRGVLLHKGSSAYHGHYEAQVFDVQNNSWYQFNDETVTQIDSLIPILKSASSKANSQQGRPRKKTRIDDSDVEITESPPPKSEPSMSDEQNYASSKDAYMLVYARASNPSEPRTADSSSMVPVKAENGSPVPASPTDVRIPPRANEVVNTMNEEYDKKCEDYAQREKEAKLRFDEKRRIVMDIYRSWSLSSPEEESAVVSRQALELWLSRHIAKPVKRAKDKDTQQPALLSDSADGSCVISNADIICEHGKLDPDKSSAMKRIRKTAAQRILEEDQCSFEPSLEPVNVCEECVSDMFRERLYQIQHPQVISRFDEVSQVEGDDQLSYWISKPWLKDWKNNKPKMHNTSEPDPPPNDPEFAEHVSCEHGGLTTNASNRKRISQEGYSILKEIFPDWVTLSSRDEVCPVCEALVHISKEDKRGIRKQAEDEKAKLKHMFDMVIKSSNSVIEDEPCAIIPNQFLRTWKLWLFRPTELPRPAGIDNSPFICQHGHLILDPNIAGDMEDIAVIRRRDYAVLEDLYPCGPLISVVNNGDNITHDLPVCNECRLEKKSTFETAEVTVRVLRPSDPIPTPDSFYKGSTLGEYRGRQPYPVTYGSRKVNGVRQSKRIRQVNGQGKRRKLTITREMTIKELKIELQDELSIPTIYQRLFHQGRELEDNTATLGSLGIVSNDVLDLREEAEDVDLIGSDDDENRGKRSAEGRAFGGTLLGGDQPITPTPTTSTTRESSSDTPAEPVQATLTCPACTFANSPDAVACEMCDTFFDCHSAY